uniref:Uncharacterized protein n=1 Tax=Neisseria meningitidis alpha275 TaxID=295996 RepID=C6SHT1_NEIME|nr:hypothetical protein predicted by Glimmer/Critica [Neisseria meningitidis alpha275]
MITDAPFPAARKVSDGRGCGYFPALSPCHSFTPSLADSADLGDTMKLFSISSLFGKIDASEVYFSSIKSRAGRLAGA